MKVVIVNCFDTYEDRVDLLHDFFVYQGYDVTVIQSNFRHFKKVKRVDNKQDFIFVNAKPYYKNMSFKRLKSHYDYAKNSFSVVEDLKPDLLYVLVPPNSAAKFAAEYKRKNTNVKLIFDLIDLWPETMPIERIKGFPLINFWRLIRDENLKYADFVITECDLYQKVLKNILKDIKTETVYLAKKEVNTNNNPMFNKEGIHLCYLGSINNIIDIPKIKILVKLINEIKPVTLHIIGDGESKDNLITEIKDTGATVEYHGKIYDPQKKQDIFDKCQFGLNIMKKAVCVGLTMKSIDYFQAGLPIINNIQADTTVLVDKYKIGINLTGENIENVADKVASINMKEFLQMRKSTYNLYSSLFSVEAFNKKIQEIVKEL